MITWFQNCTFVINYSECTALIRQTTLMHTKYHCALLQWIMADFNNFQSKILLIVCHSVKKTSGVCFLQFVHHNAVLCQLFSIYVHCKTWSQAIHSFSQSLVPRDGMTGRCGRRPIGCQLLNSSVFSPMVMAFEMSHVQFSRS